MKKMDDENEICECEICGGQLEVSGRFGLNICQDCFVAEAEKIFDRDVFDMWKRAAGDCRIAVIEERQNESGYRYGTILRDEESSEYIAAIHIQGQDYHNEETAKTFPEALKKLSGIFGNCL